MEERKEETLEVLLRIQKESEEQKKYARKQFRLLELLTGFCMVVTVLLVMTVFTVVPRANTVIENLEVVTGELAKTDLSEFDIATLNEAIRDLKDVVGPLADLFGGR
jgi:hypothetical protein